MHTEVSKHNGGTENAATLYRPTGHPSFVSSNTTA
jgi:hypothetical protein